MHLPPLPTKPSKKPVLVKGAAVQAPAPSPGVLSPPTGKLKAPPLQKAERPGLEPGKGGNLVVWRASKGDCAVKPPVVEPGTPALRPEVQRMVAEGKQRFATTGYAGVDARIAELEHIGQTSRMTEEARAIFELELRLTRALRGGDGGIAARLGEVDRLMMVALMTPAQSKAMTEEHIALKGLREAFAPLQARAADIERVQQAGALGPDLALTYGVEGTALNGLIDGGDRLAATRRDAEQQLLAGTLDPAGEREAGLIVSVTTAAQGGLEGIAARVAAIAHTRMVARLTPEGMMTLAIEEKVLASLERELQKV